MDKKIIEVTSLLKCHALTTQVVAMDGGALKGTGTASIKVKDINDMPPTFTKQEWVTEVMSCWIIF